jgi:predicted acetyltransferase
MHVTMAASLVPAAPGDAALLRNLVQLYCYDFADIVGGEVGPEGLFPAPSLDAYWQDAWRHPFVIRVGEHPAGFALVHHKSRITGDRETWDLAEFFVLRQHRRRGVGEQIATTLFDSHPGRWEVRERRQNEPAIRFWRRVIARYTGGRFVETSNDDERWRGPVQSFVTRERAPTSAR